MLLPKIQKENRKNAATLYLSASASEPCPLPSITIKMFLMPEFSVRPARSSDREPLSRLFHALWPENPAEHYADELAPTLAGTPVSSLPSIIFVAESADTTLVGFLEVSLRSHADGCDVRHPVGYVEGWYLIETHRGRGIGKQLLHAAEDWARTQGCTEMASDAWIDNDLSHRVHQHLGFEVVDRCIHYRKSL
jgi:aminoglycoside 6'-N-acetyltransferase I